MKILCCPNCNALITGHPRNECALKVLIGIVRDRGNTSEAVLLQLYAKCDVDALWDRLEPIIDDLELGEFNA